ncbi:hypothetical protein KC19_9G005800 [Ceratodon purpureus]|uniref:Deoxyhypusine hydroxylase n=1 Tax=Ceratodon purpureus TaxID=3225 RepID=A0A8T0GQ34_CERPU|nr:hypothetical protein KC19_9G005800 [Ceratodon purpureus]
MAAATSVVIQPIPTAMPAAAPATMDVSDVDMVAFLRRCLLDPSMPIALRWRAILSLRNRKGPGSRQALVAAMSDESALLAHEAAFSLGQMQDPESIPGLRATLKGIEEFHPIVRHEAAEALGAIGTPECLELLQVALVCDPAPEVRETCDLALHRIENVQAEDLEDSPFRTVDPAVAASSSSSVAEMRKKLLDENEQLHERYAALFGLRNRGGSDAVAAIIASLKCESALLKHEVAYVLGQLQDKASTDALVDTLKDVTEHPMVRHEAAEALGSIADERSVELLKVFSSDPEPIVAQSCEVALHMLELEQQGKPFELRLDSAA